MSSYYESIQQAMSGVLQPSQNGIDALAATQQSLAMSQDTLGELTASVAPNADLGNMRQNLTKAGQKTAEALALLGQISSGIQEMMGRVGIELPELNLPNQAPMQSRDTVPSPQPAAETTSRETLATVSTGDFTRHALAFYGNILDTYAKEQTKNGKGTEQARQRWTEANKLMCTFALDIEDLQLASQCFGYLESDDAKWDLVAKAYHAGYPLLAESWQRPLLLAIEHGEDNTLTLVAAQKARTSMALDRANLAKNEQDKAEQLREVDAAWRAASKLLDDARGNGMVPSKSQGLFESDHSDIPAMQDARTHMLDFVQLYCANGEFQRAREISDQITHLTRESQAYYRNVSREASRAVGEFLPTIDLREQCAGLTAEEVVRRARRWQLYPRDTVLAKVGDLIRKPQMPLWHGENTPGLHTACAFLEEIYPEFTFKGPQIANESRATYDIVRSGWEDTARLYEANLHWSSEFKDPLVMLDDALQLARREQTAMAELQIKQHQDIGTIRDIQRSWENEYPHADTFAIPELRQAKLDQLQKLIDRPYHSATLQHEVFVALLEAQKRISPKANLVQEGIISYVNKKLRALQSVPNYEQEFAGQLAELTAMRQLVGGEAAE